MKKSLPKFKHAKVSKAEPVYLNCFEATFHSSVLSTFEEKLLNEQVVTVSVPRNFASNSLKKDFGLELPKYCHISFNLNVIKKKPQPLAVIEKLSKKNEPFDIKISVFTKFGNVFRKIFLKGCLVETFHGMENFDYTANSIDDLHVSFTYKKCVIK